MNFLSFFLFRNFVTDYDPTIEDSYSRHCQVDERLCVLDILDTAGQEEFSAMREQYMRKGDGFLIVYSVTDVASFESVANFVTQILRVKDRDTCPMLLVANKVDLVSLRKISEEVGRDMALAQRIPYIETSAFSAFNVDNAFGEMVRIVRSQNGEAAKIEKSKAGKGRLSRLRKWFRKKRQMKLQSNSSCVVS